LPTQGRTVVTIPDYVTCVQTPSDALLRVGAYQQSVGA
jgi:hypothetical protein